MIISGTFDHDGTRWQVFDGVVDPESQEVQLMFRGQDGREIVTPWIPKQDVDGMTLEDLIEVLEKATQNEVDER